MIIKCPKCHNLVAVKGLGRKPLNIPLNNVCEALQVHGSVPAAAQVLNCSPGYIYNILKTNGLKFRDVVQNQGNI